jgi:hypothetical protein
VTNHGFFVPRMADADAQAVKIATPECGRV